MEQNISRRDGVRDLLFFVLLVSPVIALTATNLFMSEGTGSNESMISMMQDHLSFYKLLQGVSSLLVFGLPAFIFMLRRKYSYNFYNTVADVKPNAIFISILLLLAFSPIILFTAYWNQQMHLPAWLSNVEKFFRTMEDNTAKLTEMFLTMNSVADLLLNVFIIGIIPGVVEEFMFRGCFQNIFQKIFNNKHIAIWLAAILFSAIHFQFYGFVPRMLIGAVLGYVYVYTQSIWCSVAMHIFNNSLQVVIAYFNPTLLGKNDAETPEINWLYIIPSILVSYILLDFFRKKSASKITV